MKKPPRNPEADTEKILRIRAGHYTELIETQGKFLDALRALIVGEKDPVRVSFIKRTIIDAGGTP